MGFWYWCIRICRKDLDTIKGTARLAEADVSQPIRTYSPCSTLSNFDAIDDVSLQFHRYSFSYLQKITILQIMPECRWCRFFYYFFFGQLRKKFRVRKVLWLTQHSCAAKLFHDWRRALGPSGNHCTWTFANAWESLILRSMAAHDCISLGKKLSVVS